MEMKIKQKRLNICGECFQWKQKRLNICGVLFTPSSRASARTDCESGPLPHLSYHDDKNL